MKSFRSFRTYGAAVVAVVALAGCGSEVSSQAEQPVASALEQPNYSGLKVYSLFAAGFSIGVPADWTALTAEDAAGPGLDAILADEPKLATYRELFSGAESPVKLVAMEYDPDACICSTINVLAIPRTPGWKARDFEAGALDTSRKMALPGTKPATRRVRTPAGSGVRVTTRTKLAGTDVTVIATQYIIHTRRNAYVISFSATPAVTKTYLKLFDRSARSLREV